MLHNCLFSISPSLLASTDLHVDNDIIVYRNQFMQQLPFSLCLSSIYQKSTHTAWMLYACNWQGYTVLSNKFNRHAILVYCGQLKQVIDCPGGIKFTKDLKFSIQRAQKPLSITALKFSTLSLKSFTTVSVFYHF